MQSNVKLNSKGEALDFLNALYLKGLNNIGGIDEVGRGGLCGDVVVGCVVLPKDHGIVGLRDSKQLSSARRKELVLEIQEKSIAYSVGASSPEEIESLNIRQAAHLAAVRAVSKCSVELDYLLCDAGLHLEGKVSCPTRPFIKGDDLFDSISAASILAKVYRDEQMVFYHEIYPEYGFNNNAGYGTKKHLEAIKTFGLTPIHRRTFGICREYR